MSIDRAIIKESALSDIADITREKLEISDKIYVKDLRSKISGMRLDNRIKRIAFLERTIEYINASDLQGCTYFRPYAFAGCDKLKRIEIPESVTRIAGHAFAECDSLETVILHSNVKFNTLHTASNGGTFAESGIRYIDLPVSVIPKNCFRHCQNLERVSFLADLTELGQDAFSDCPSLLAIDIPGSLKEIASFAFEKCSSLSDIKLNEGLEIIGSYAFSYTAASKVVIPSTVKSIGKACFTMCKSLSEVEFESADPPTIDPGTTYSGMFYGCSSLSKIVVPKGSLDAYKTAIGLETWADIMVEKGAVSPEDINWVFKDKSIEDGFYYIHRVSLGLYYTLYVDGEAKCTRLVDSDIAYFDYNGGCVEYDHGTGEWYFYYDPPSEWVQSSGTISLESHALRKDWLFEDARLYRDESVTDLPLPEPGVTYTAYLSGCDFYTNTCTDTGVTFGNPDTSTTIIGNCDIGYWSLNFESLIPYCDLSVAKTDTRYTIKFSSRLYMTDMGDIYPNDDMIYVSLDGLSLDDDDYDIILVEDQYNVYRAKGQKNQTINESAYSLFGVYLPASGMSAYIVVNFMSEGKPVSIKSPVYYFN